jgi:hypothetical protein
MADYAFGSNPPYALIRLKGELEAITARNATHAAHDRL